MRAQLGRAVSTVFIYGLAEAGHVWSFVLFAGFVLLWSVWNIQRYHEYVDASKDTAKRCLLGQLAYENLPEAKQRSIAEQQAPL